MKNWTFYCLIVLAFVLLVGLMFVRMPVTPDLSEKEIPVRAPALPIKASAILAPEPAMASVIPPPSSPVPAPTDNSAYQQPDAPGTIEITIPGSVGEATIPAAWGVKDSDPSLTPEQQQRITLITQAFVKEINSGNVNASDPDYLSRWQKAQAEADDNLRVIIGEQAFLRCSEAAGQMAMSIGQ